MIAHCDFCVRGTIEITKENWKERTCAGCIALGAPSGMSPTYEKELAIWLKKRTRLKKRDGRRTSRG